MANLDDLLSAAKNIVIALNTINTTVGFFGGQQTSATVTSSTLVVNGSGVIVNFSVTTGGTTAGAVHDAGTTATASASNALAIAPTTAGTYTGVHRFTKGIVIVPGAGQSINVTYSLS